MKSRSKTFLQSTSLALIFMCFFVGAYASNGDSNYKDSSMSKSKVQKKSHFQYKAKLTSLKDSKIIEEEMQLEDWMFNCCFYSCYDCDRNEIENWMLNKFFWIIYDNYDINEEPNEEESELEYWMFDCEQIKCSSSGIYTNYLEKEWLKKHKFFIL